MSVTRGNTVNVDYTLNESASTASLACTLPSAMAAGKLLVAHVVASTSSPGLPGTGGWQWAAGSPLGTNNEVLTGLAYTTDPAAGLAFTQATAGRMTVILTVYSGEDALTVVDVTPTTNNVLTQSMTLTGITTVTDGDMLVSGCGINASTITTITQPTSWNLVARNTSGTGKGGAYADFSQTTHGATGNQIWTNDATAGLRQAGYLAAVRAATTGSFPAATSVVPQQSSVTRVPPLVVAPTIGPPQVIRLPQITVVRHVKQPPAPFPLAVNPPLLPAQARPAAPITVASQARLPQPPTISVSAPQIPTPTAGILPVTVTVVAEQFHPATVTPIVLTPPLLPQPPPLPASVLALPPATRPQPVQPLAITPPPLPQPATPILVVTSSRPPGPLQIVIGAPQFPAPAAGILPPAPIMVVTSTWQPAAPQTVLSQPQPAAVAAILPPAPILIAPAFIRPGSAYVSVSKPQLLSLSVMPTAPILVVPTFSRFRLGPISVSQPTAPAPPTYVPAYVGVDGSASTTSTLDGATTSNNTDGTTTAGGLDSTATTTGALDGGTTSSGTIG